MYWLDDSTTNLHIELITSILPFKPNVIISHLELLEDDKFVEILRDTSQNIVSVKIKPRGVKKVLGALQNDVQSQNMTSYHFS